MIEMPNNWRLDNLGIFKKIPVMVGIDGEYLAGRPEGKLWQMCWKMRKISCKTFQRKTKFT